MLIPADTAAYDTLIAVERPVTTFVGEQADLAERIKPIEGLDAAELRAAYSEETPGKYHRRDNYEGAVRAAIGLWEITEDDRYRALATAACRAMVADLLSASDEDLCSRISDKGALDKQNFVMRNACYHFALLYHVTKDLAHAGRSVALLVRFSEQIPIWLIFRDDKPFPQSDAGKLNSGSPRGFWGTWMFLDIHNGVPPITEGKSYLFGCTGHAILGYGKTKPDMVQATLHFGGTHGHEHCDMLNLILWAKGRELISETRYRPLDITNTTREWHRATAGHVTVVVDGKNHTTRWDKHTPKRQSQPTDAIHGVPDWHWRWRCYGDNMNNGMLRLFNPEFESVQVVEADGHVCSGQWVSITQDVRLAAAGNDSHPGNGARHATAGRGAVPRRPPIGRREPLCRRPPPLRRRTAGAKGGACRAGAVRWRGGRYPGHTSGSRGHHHLDHIETRGDETLIYSSDDPGMTIMPNVVKLEYFPCWGIVGKARFQIAGSAMVRGERLTGTQGE